MSVNFLSPRFEANLDRSVARFKLPGKRKTSACIVSPRFATLHVGPDVEMAVLHRVDFQHDEEFFVGLLDSLKLGERFERGKN